MDKNEERKVAAWYDALSKGYDELYGSEQSLKERLVLDFIALSRFSLLVDVGCGSATLLRDAAKTYDFSIGVDLSLKMLIEAKKKKPPNNDLVLATSRNLPIRDGLIDCVVSVSTLKADSNLRPILREFRRISKKEATFAISTFGNPRDELPFRASDLVRSVRISDRESAYFVLIGKRDQKMASRHGTLA